MSIKCKEPKFKVIVCCQGQQFEYHYKTLFGALVGYAKQYLQKKIRNYEFFVEADFLIGAEE